MKITINPDHLLSAVRYIQTDPILTPERQAACVAKTYTFKINRWLDAGEDDNQIRNHLLDRVIEKELDYEEEVEIYRQFREQYFA